MQDPTEHTPEQLAEIAKRVEKVMSEDYRVTAARKVLTESEASTSATDRDDYSAARWHGRLEATVKMLLDYIDERGES
jgi:hypothetical protein